MRCDCGFEVSADGQELVDVAQAHARDVHGMELPAELVLALASGESRGLATPDMGDDRGRDDTSTSTLSP